MDIPEVWRACPWVQFILAFASLLLPTLLRKALLPFIELFVYTKSVSLLTVVLKQREAFELNRVHKGARLRAEHTSSNTRAIGGLEKWK